MIVARSSAQRAAPNVRVWVAGILLAVALAGCSGPFFYRDVIVPTYRQVDPHVSQPVQP